MYVIYWSKLAVDSYRDEADFILNKWNYQQVAVFALLIEKHLQSIAFNPFIGKKYSSKDLFCLTISKQTNLYYTIDLEQKMVNLVLFWNNSKNPKNLIHLL